MASTELPQVLFLHPSDELYGSDRQLLQAIDASLGLCQPVVVLPDDIDYEGRLSAELRSREVEVVRGPLPVLRRAYLGPRALPRWLLRSVLGLWWTRSLMRERRPAAVVTNTTAAFAGPLVSRLSRIPHVWYVHEIVESPGWYRGLVRRLARLPRGSVVAISHAVADWIGELGVSGPVVIHNAVASGDAPADLPTQPRAVFVGRLNEWKGWQDFVSASELVHERVQDAAFSLVGDFAPGGQVSGADLGVLSRVEESEGWLEWDGETSDARSAMRQAWIVVAPSTRPEPFGNVAIEAMAEGRAVIASSQGGFRESVVDQVTGVLVPASDVDALSDAMFRLLTDRSRTQRMGEAGRQRQLERFNLPRWRREWGEVLARTIHAA